MNKRWLGIDIGGTHTRLLMLQGEDEWYGFRKVSTDSWSQAPDALATLARLIQAELNEQPVAGIMLGLPGILSRDREHVVSLPFIPSLNDMPVATYLSDITGVPVAMDKDVNHLMYWDLLQLETMPEHAVGVYLGTGMGNSLWLNGRFYHGEYGGSGEIGHIPWADNQQLCACGNRGCVETLTSGHWLACWAREHAPQVALSQLFSAHGSHPSLQRFINRLAQVIAGEINILDPQYLVLGGGVTAMENFPMTALIDQIRSHLRPPVTRDGLRVIVSRATDQTGCRGACLAARQRFRRAE